MQVVEHSLDSDQKLYVEWSLSCLSTWVIDEMLREGRARKSLNVK